MKGRGIYFVKGRKRSGFDRMDNRIVQNSLQKSIISENPNSKKEYLVCNFTQGCYGSRFTLRNTIALGITKVLSKLIDIGTIDVLPRLLYG